MSDRDLLDMLESIVRRVMTPQDPYADEEARHWWARQRVEDAIVKLVTADDSGASHDG